MIRDLEMAVSFVGRDCCLGAVPPLCRTPPSTPRRGRALANAGLRQSFDFRNHRTRLASVTLFARSRPAFADGPF